MFDKETIMDNIYRKYAVYDEYGKETHTVIAGAFSVGDGGTLIFKKRDVVGAYEAWIAFASGYWSRVEFIETVEAVG
jgi:hypothetical protein